MKKDEEDEEDNYDIFLKSALKVVELGEKGCDVSILAANLVKQAETVDPNNDPSEHDDALMLSNLILSAADHSKSETSFSSFKDFSIFQHNVASSTNVEPSPSPKFPKISIFIALTSIFSFIYWYSLPRSCPRSIW